MKRVVIIINPIAGKGLGLQLLNYAKSSALSSEFLLDLQVTEGPGDAIRLTKKAVSSGVDIVVAAGGDGTVNEVASALVHTTTAMGIIPIGSGNGLARQLGWSERPKIALEQLRTGSADKIDTLIINGRFGVNVSGLGMDGYVAWRFNHEGHRGLSSYTKIALQEFFRYPAVEYQIQTESGVSFVTSAHMLVIANSPEFGNRAIIAPRASMCDGLMDLVLVKRPPIIHLPGIMLRLFKGTLKENRWVKVLRTHKLLVEANRAVHLHIDGESLDPVNHLEATVLPKSLTIIRPGNP
jgi:YegS/Rv2252/BmrU family lipid kinase